MNLEKARKIRAWAVRKNLISPGETLSESITKGEVLEMLYKISELNFDKTKTETYEEVER